MMTFLAFNLIDFHRQSKDGVRVRIKFVRQKSLDSARQFVKTHYLGAWAIVSKKAFDKGIVHNPGEERKNESRLEDRA